MHAKAKIEENVNETNFFTEVEQLFMKEFSFMSDYSLLPNFTFNFTILWNKNLIDFTFVKALFNAFCKYSKSINFDFKLILTVLINKHYEALDLNTLYLFISFFKLTENIDKNWICPKIN